MLAEFKAMNRSSKKKEQKLIRINGIEDILSDEELNTTDPTVVLFEGPMQRYHPGFSKHFFPKWCQITKSHFLYF